MRNVSAICLIALVAAASTQASESLDIKGDRTVEFRFKAPSAQKVEVQIVGMTKPLPMGKNEDGTWSAFTQTLAPDIYIYTFSVDGMRELDPSNPNYVPNLLNPSNSFTVPGTPPLPWEESDVQHGIVHHHFYKSSILGANRDFYVYTPPGYDPAATVKYPVLYLLHGFSDNASAWTSVGKANDIFDALLSEGKMKPMVVVMPLGYGAPEILTRPGASDDPAVRSHNFEVFRNILTDEVMPIAESRYRVSADRKDHAIAGLSMGGAEALLIGLNRLDKFAYVGSFSAGRLGETNPSVSFPQLRFSARGKVNLLWMACGTGDPRLAANRQLESFFRGEGLSVTAVETPGVHAWSVWRRNLVAFAPMLFGNASATAAPVPTSSK